jgi:hypothetical protein
MRLGVWAVWVGLIGVGDKPGDNEHFLQLFILTFWDEHLNLNTPQRSTHGWRGFFAPYLAAEC